MNLLDAKLYDPGTAVAKSTASLLAMTAFDTTNLRLTVTVPAHGMLHVRMRTNLSGATTMPQVLLGVLDGSTVRGRVVPLAALPGTALGTTNVPLVAEFTMVGLSPGSMTLDAAYAVETAVASTNIHYGGPNNTSGNDAWGAFVFEIWDPRPLKLALDGGVNVTQFGGSAGTFSGGRPEVNTSHLAGTAQTGRDIGASVLLSSGTGTGQVKLAAGYVAPNWGDVGNPTTAVNLSGTTVKTATDVEADTVDIQARLPAALTVGGNMKSDMLALNGGTGSAADLKDFADTGYDPATHKVQGVVLTDTVTTYTGNTPQTGDSFARIGATGSGLTSLAPSATALSTAQWTNGRAANLDNLNATVSSRATQASVDTIDGIVDAILVDTAEIGAAGAGLTALGDARLGNLDAAVTTRAPSATALSTAQWTNGRAGNLDNLDALISSRLASGSYTAPNNAGIAAIKLQTDKFTFTVPNTVDVNLQFVNDVELTGDGAATPWGP